MKVSRAVVAQRSQDITRVCRKLYVTMALQEISLKDISSETSFLRPALYNYFQSKEEIFLAILREEYDLWAASLQDIRQQHDTMTVTDFADAVGQSLEQRTTMLKIQCMNLYEIEEHSRLEHLTAFKESYGHARDVMDDCLKAYVPDLTTEERQIFPYTFLPFMYGIYPYVYPTAWQLESMRLAGIDRPDVSIRQLTRHCICKLLTKGD